MLILRTHMVATRSLCWVSPRWFAKGHTVAVSRLTTRMRLKGWQARALAVAQAAVAAHRRHPHHTSCVWALARLLRNEAAQLLVLSRLDAALTAVEEAITLYGQLPRTRDVARDHAYARITRSRIFCGNGRIEQAVAEADGAVTEIRNLPPLTPVDRHSLAYGLQAKALAEHARRHFSDAAALLREAVSMYEQLPLHWRWGRYLAFGIELRIRLASALHDAGDLAGALAEGRTVAGWADSLDTPMTRALRPLNAENKLVLAIAAAGHGEHEEAAAAADRAVEVLRSLVAENWSARAPRLAAALDYQSQTRAALDRGDPVAPMRERVEIYTRLAAEQPDRAVDRANALAGLSDRLWGAGQRDESAEVTERALDAYLQLARASQDQTVEVDIVRVRIGLTSRLAELDCGDRAVRVGDEAVIDARRLAAGSAEHRGLLRRALDALGRALDAAGRATDAATVRREQLLVTRQLASEQPESFGQTLASELLHLGVELCKLDRAQEAVDLAEETLDLMRTVPDASKASQSALTKVRDGIGHVLRFAERYERAVEVGRESISRWRDLADTEPAHHGDLAYALKARSAALDRLGRTSEALRDIEDAIAALRHPDVESSDYRVRTWWNWLAERSRLQVLLGRVDEAVRGVRELRDHTHGTLDEHGRDRVDKLYERVRSADPEQVVSAWRAATGEPWPPAVT